MYLLHKDPAVRAGISINSINDMVTFLKSLLTCTVYLLHRFRLALCLFTIVQITPCNVDQVRLFGCTITKFSPDSTAALSSMECFHSLFWKSVLQHYCPGSVSLLSLTLFPATATADSGKTCSDNQLYASCAAPNS